MAVNYLHKRSGTADKRPTAASLDVGELALNYESGDPGLFFEDSSGAVRKIGPVTVGATAPNASPAGSSGNSVGELWLDTTNSGAVLKIWNGSAWVVIEGQTGANTADTEVLFSNAGVITGDAEFTYDADNNVLTVEHVHGDLSGMVQFECEASVAISKGEAVYVDGISGNNPTINLAQANSSSTMPAFGIAAEDIALGATGHVTIVGSLGTLDTQTPSFSLGDTLYVSATTAGGLVNTPPTGETNLIQNVGLVERVSTTVGRIKVNSAGRTSATPNLNDGNIFVGNASNQSVSDAFTDVLAAQSGITTNASDLTVDRHILPDTTLSYDLGSSTQRFRDIYLSSNTIDLGGTTISVSDGNLAVAGENLVKASDPVVTGDVNMSDNSEIHLYELSANGTDYLGFKAPTSLTATTTFTLPDGDGTTQQVLQTNGSGTLSWASVTTAASPIFSGNPQLSNAGEFRWVELTSNGTDYIGFKAPDSVTTSTVFTWPDGDGTSGQSLKTDGSGNLGWTTNTLDDLGSVYNIFVGSGDGSTTVSGFGTVLYAVTGLNLTNDEIQVVGRDIAMTDNHSINFYEIDENGTNAVELASPQNIAATYMLRLPGADGTNGQVMTTDGSGNLSFTTVGGLTGVTDSTTGSVLTLTDSLTSVSTDFAVNTNDLYVDISTERVGIGTTTPTARLDVQGATQSEVVALHYNNDTANAAFIDIYKSRGTSASPTAVQAGDGIASVDSFAYNGTSYVDSGRIEWDATDSAGNSKFLVSTRVNGTLADRLTIGSDGHLRMSAGSDLIFNAPSTAPSLTVNGETTFEATSDLVMRIKHRGSDGITRTGNVALNQGVGTYGIGAHVSFDASAGASFDDATDIIASGNIASVTRTAEGKFTITFDQAFSSTAYTVVATAGDADHTGVGAGSRTANLTARSASSVDIVVERADDGVNVDDGYIAVICIGLVS